MVLREQQGGQGEYRGKFREVARARMTFPRHFKDLAFIPSDLGSY